ncbi:ABC transporter permease [Diplocloster modestus]|uniref:ABC transporter permease n=1 Tax=Diplocloster modestus TaxID=2850322 RepID=UPI001EE90932|nr:ABC transporter permease [Diplocloster modestus]
MIKDVFLLYTDRFDFFLQCTLEHLTLSLAAIMIAVFLGLGLGILMAQMPRVSRLLIGIISVVYTIPSIALLGFLIPFTGVGDTTALIALVVYGLLPMTRNTYLGIRGIDPPVIEAAYGMGSTDTEVLFRIKLPLAVPVILGGIRNMAVMTVSLAGVASFIGAGGLGVAIYRGITTNNPAMTLTGSLLIAVIALIFDFSFGVLDKRYRRKRRLPS